MDNWYSQTVGKGCSLIDQILFDPDNSLSFVFMWIITTIIFFAKIMITIFSKFNLASIIITSLYVSLVHFIQFQIY